MADTIQQLYESFAQQMEPIQEDDRYFRYLYEMAQASETTLEQKREVLLKKVDERWISEVENALDSIYTVVANPRRFVTTEEELVPVALARKISSESIRHLSMHTEYIDPSDDGEVHPSKILNVSTQETFDLYENRFVFHLIKRLLTFVDKRTDVIFWQTTNEVQNHFVMHTTIDDAYETISYDVNMVVKNKQSAVDNEADNMDVFMRIDRVRRMVLALRRTAFYEIMDGCAKVRSPIQRTNLIMKDPDYRKCYQLWQFMESYDEVGYTIEVDDTEMAVDEEYMIQMYTNLINNYAVFKSLTLDERRLSEIEQTRHEVIKPVYVKEIQEQIVPDCNIPDVEIRKVFVDEVTEKQLAAEAALAEEQERAKGLEQEIKDRVHEIVLLNDKCDSLDKEITTAKSHSEELAARVRFAESAQERAEAEAKSALQVASDQKDKAEEASKAAAAATAHAEEMEQVAAAAQEDAASTRAQAAAAVADAEAAATAAVREAQEAAEATRVQAEAAVANAEAAAAASIEAMQAETDERISATEAKAADAVRKAQEAADAKVAAADENAAEQIAATKERAEAEKAAAEQRAAAEVARIKEQTAAEIANAKLASEAEIANTKDQATAALNAARESADAEIASIKSDAERDLAQERSNHAADLQRLREESAVSMEHLRADSDARLEYVKEQAAKERADAAKKADQDRAALESKAAREQAALESQIEELKKQLRKAERDRDRALRKAEGNGFSRLFKRNKPSENNDEGEGPSE